MDLNYIKSDSIKIENSTDDEGPDTIILNAHLETAGTVLTENDFLMKYEPINEVLEDPLSNSNQEEEDINLDLIEIKDEVNLKYEVLEGYDSDTEIDQKYSSSTFCNLSEGFADSSGTKSVYIKQDENINSNQGTGESLFEIIRPSVAVKSFQLAFKCKRCLKVLEYDDVFKTRFAGSGGRICGECNNSMKLCNVRRFQCKVCGKKVSTASILKTHMWQRHTIGEVKKVTGIICQKKFLDKTEDRQNQESHIPTTLEISEELQSQALQSGTYKCIICKISFSNFDLFFIHIKRHSSTYYTYKCSDKMFSRYSLETDRKCKKALPICLMCGEEFEEEKFFLHIDGHFKTSASTCDYCHGDFSDKALHAHMKSHFATEKVFSCNACSKVFLRKEHLDRHIALVHVFCRICEKLLYFKNPEMLALHYKIIHTPDTYSKCKLCHATFRLKSRLAFHMNNVHFKIGKFPCKICGMQFVRYRNLLAHGKRHNKEIGLCPPKIRNQKTKQTCKICFDSHNILLTFWNLTSFKRHIVKKHPEKVQKVLLKVYKCKMCAWIEFSEDRIFQHLERHSNNKLYQCSQCSKNYGMLYNLNKHVAKSHKKGDMYCDICKKHFHSKCSIYKVQYHRIHKCKTCDVAFSSVKELRGHKAIEHAKRKGQSCNNVSSLNHMKENRSITYDEKIIAYICDICKKPFFTKNALKSHLKFHFLTGQYVKC